MWLDFGGQGTQIEMDPTTIRAGGTQILNQVIRGTDAMGIHFSNLGTTAAGYCLCDIWDSSIPGLTDELGALGETVLGAFNAYLTATSGALTRANQIQADQAQATAAPALGSSADPSFGALLAQAIVADGNAAAAGAWLGSTPSTSSVDVLLAMQGAQGGAGGTDVGAMLAGMMNDANDDMASTWLAPEGTTYMGRDDSGSKLYSDDYGDVGTLSDIHRDTYDENSNGSTDDYDVSS